MPIKIIVQKFGGSSVRDAARLLRACEIIKAAHSAGNAVVAVFSAQGDTTDELIARAKEITSHPSPRELDALLSTGECASVALGAMMLHRLGVPAVSLAGWQAGIKTDTNYGAARVSDIDCQRILRELDAGKVVLVAGFQGLADGGDITTLGRGGSDTSAVALAAYLHAELCQIYTDVDGVYTTDPRICPAARHMEAVSFSKMLLLAAAGAQVLHDRSVALAERFNVNLEVCGCLPGSRSTRITASVQEPPVTGVTRSLAANGFVGITAVGEKLPDTKLQEKLCAVLTEDGIVLGGVEQATHCLRIWVEEEAAEWALCLVHAAIFSAE